MLKHRVRAWIKKRSTQNRFLAKCMAEVLYYRLQRRGNLPGNDILEIIDIFVSPEKELDARWMRKLKKDMLFSRLYYQIGNEEYFLYHFDEKSDSGRKKYIGRLELDMLQAQLNSFGKPEILNNKEKTYELFKDYYCRDLVCIRDRSQKEAFLSFTNKHRAFVIKPLSTYGGKGIERVEVYSFQDAEEAFERYVQQFPFLIEELIIQDPVMAKFHPQSVNTVRYNTFFNEGKLTRVQAAIRMGRGGNCVDNSSSGGLFALVDTETGIVKEAARSLHGEQFLIHPDTGIQIIGAKIPSWKELNELLEYVVRVLPEQKQVGWDFALSKNGWVLVEANSHPAIQRFDLAHGLRQQIVDVFCRTIPEG